ncbi:MAG: nucleotidyltransferase domain-containing protein [Candidatus Bathyarchaeia archaeon]
MRLRDRDAIITREGLIFRVFGYAHPPDGFICDAEYAPAELFKSQNPKAFRTDGKRVFYKFYEDEGWKFVEKNFPNYMIFHEPLGMKVVGVKCSDVSAARKPQEILKVLLEKAPKDELLKALQAVLEVTVKHSSLKVEDFGVFGSLLHGFYHPKFSDIDLIVYGSNNLEQLRETLKGLYADEDSPFHNEFEDDAAVKGKRWLFKNISPKEFLWHQKRKLIYGVFYDDASKRAIKVEFEPVKSWNEINNEYGEIKKITREGWVKAFLRIKDDVEAPFIPSIYHTETLKIVNGLKIEGITRVVSYLEEYRMQAWKDEAVYVEGNLEKVEKRNGECFHQIALTYGPRYYEQVLKVVKSADEI